MFIFVKQLKAVAYCYKAVAVILCHRPALFFVTYLLYSLSQTCFILSQTCSILCHRPALFSITDLLYSLSQICSILYHRPALFFITDPDDSGESGNGDGTSASNENREYRTRSPSGDRALSHQSRIGLQDFTFIKVLGKGSFGKVRILIKPH